MGQEGYDSYTFTEQDSLRGSLSILRSSYDVRFYDLDLTVDMDSESISGSVGIDFDVLEDLSQIQLDYSSTGVHIFSQTGVSIFVRMK